MSKQINREQFGAEASAYIGSKTHAKGASLARLVELVQPQSHWRVLDVATGAGHTALAFAPYVAVVTATDITPEMLAAAQQLARERNLPNIRFDPADAEALPYNDGAFDLVTCRIAPHHFGDIPLFLREAARVLRPGGLLALVDNVVPAGPAGDYVNAFEKLRDPSHGRCLSSREWVDAFSAAGLSLLLQETLSKSLDFAFWAKRHDVTMQAYLLAMLSEASGPAAEFLHPELSAGIITFQLSEGLFICQKPAEE